MPIRGLPNGVRHTRPQADRDHPQQVVAIDRNGWSRSIVAPGRDHPLLALMRGGTPIWTHENRAKYNRDTFDTPSTLRMTSRRLSNRSLRQSSQAAASGEPTCARS